MIRIDATVGTHDRVFPRIVIHEIVRGESNDPPRDLHTCDDDEREERSFFFQFAFGGGGGNAMYILCNVRGSFDA